MQGHYLTHFAAMLQIKLNVLVVGQETCRSRFYPGVGGGGAYNRMYFLFKGKFVYYGGPMGGGGAYKRRFTALQQCFSFSLLFYSIPKS